MFTGKGKKGKCGGRDKPISGNGARCGEAQPQPSPMQLRLVLHTAAVQWERATSQL